MAIGQSKKLVPIVWDVEAHELPGWVAERQALNLRGAPPEEIAKRMTEIAEQLKQETLSERDGEIHRVLARVDAALAGLFWFLIRAISEAERPGGVQMLGHAGRELSLGVIRYLGRDSLSEESPSAGEKHRSAIARALRLRPSHPSVAAWLNAHNELVACSHYPKEGSERVRTSADGLAAANALSSLLWSAIGPFFQAKADVNRLLAVQTPTEGDLAALNAALTRPTVRWEFFKALEHPGWVAPLFRAGFFRQGGPPHVS